jgi:hypothetical protein
MFALLSVKVLTSSTPAVKCGLNYLLAHCRCWIIWSWVCQSWNVVKTAINSCHEIINAGSSCLSRSSGVVNASSSLLLLFTGCCCCCCGGVVVLVVACGKVLLVVEGCIRNKITFTIIAIATAIPAPITSNTQIPKLYLLWHCHLP